MPGDVYEFGPFRFESATRSLYRGPEFISLAPKAADTLLALLEGAGHVVSKDQLLARVWQGVVVEEGSIASIVSQLRKILDADFGNDGPIATVARRGYRFTAPVRKGGAASATAAAPITQRDTILLGDIENRTGDPIFDGSLRQALLLHLAQTPYLQVLADQKVQATLRLMSREPTTPILGATALEICQRTGTKAAITGSILGFGDEYVIGFTVTAAEGGEIAITEQARARGKDGVLRALDGAAMSLRAKLGESLASMRRFSGTFDEVATTSLEALKAYTLGRHEWFGHGDAAAIPHYVRALELDPLFVSAHSALAITSMNIGQATRCKEHLQRAYDLRDHASARERARVGAMYWSMVAGDHYKAIDAFRIWADEFPRDSSVFINAGNSHMLLGQHERAYELCERGRQIEFTTVAHSNVAISLLALGRYAEAREVIDGAFARGIDAYFLRLDAYQEAFLRGDQVAMQQNVDAVLGRAGEEDFLIASQANTEAFHGRHERALELSRRASESARRAGSAEMSAMWLAEAALREAELGHRDSARALVKEAHQIAGGRHVDCVAAYALARGGDIASAERLASELDREYPSDTGIQRYWLPCIRAAVAIESGDWARAVEDLEKSESIELGIVMPFEGGLLLPPWLRGLAFAAGKRDPEAAREFRKIVDHPGVIKNFLLLPLARARLDS